MNVWGGDFMKPLRSYLLATASSAALMASAAAADMPTMARSIDPVMTWTGPYAGVNAGAAWDHSSFTDVDYFFFLLPTGPGNNFLSNDDMSAPRPVACWVTIGSPGALFMALKVT